MATPDDLKARLAGVQKTAAAADQAGKNIVASAEERMNQVDARMHELRLRVITDDEAASEYQTLAAERGQLALVIAGG